MASWSRKLELAAVVWSSNAARTQAAAVLGGDLQLVVWRDLAALVTPAGWDFLKSSSRRASAAAERNRSLRAAHAVGALLPAARAGAAFRNRDAVSAFLAANAAVLRQSLSEIGDREQRALSVVLPDDAAMKRIKSSLGWPTIAAAATAGDTVKMVALLSEASEAVRAELRRDAESAVLTAARDLTALPIRSETTALSAQVLTDRGGGAALEQALDALNERWKGALMIQLGAPEPAAAFGNVVVEAFEHAAQAPISTPRLKKARPARSSPSADLLHGASGVGAAASGAVGWRQIAVACAGLCVVAGRTALNAARDAAVAVLSRREVQPALARVRRKGLNTGLKAANGPPPRRLRQADARRFRRRP